MGFYSSVVFPWLCDVALDKAFIGEQRRRLLSSARGKVLEIGFGTGLNLPFYPPSVETVTAVDPSSGMQRRAKRRLAATRVRVEHHTASAEALPFGPAQFDTVVSTFTLCSVADPEQSMAEIYRVLRPGGQFLYLEHGLSPDPAVQRWQRRLNWLQIRLGQGCHLDRHIGGLVATQPFTAGRCEEFYLDQTPKTHGYMWRGIATK